MKQQFDAIYENGLLRPLTPLNLAEHERVSVTVDVPADQDWLDQEAVEYAGLEGDPTISLDQVRKSLSAIGGSLADSVIAERGEY